jgi:branched-chain amino acid transport system permease protein
MESKTENNIKIQYGHTMRRFGATWAIPILIAAVITGALLAVPEWTSSWTVVLLSSIFMYMVLTVNWTVFCGPTQYFSLGIAAFFGVGVYMASIVWEIRPEFPLLIVIILAGIASSFLALLVGLTTLRIKGIYFAIFTFGLSELLRHFVMWWEVNKTGTVGRWIPIVDNNIVYRYMVVLAAISILGAYVLRRSRYGLAMTSIGDGQEVARHMGVNANMVKIIVFAGTCFLTGAAGALIATRWSYIDADVAFDSVRTVMTIMMSLFGGMSVLYGPVMGTVILGIVSDVLLVQFPYLSRLFLGLILVFTVLFIPEGIAGLISGKHPVGIRGPLDKLRNMFSGKTKKE